MRLNIKSAESLSDFFVLALIRNECRKFLTNDQEELTVEKQVRFYLNRPNNWEIFIVKLYETPIGYGIIKVVGDKTILTGCIVESERGNGYGKEIFQFMTNISKELNLIPTLDVFKDNEPAVCLYKKLGYTVVSEKDNKLFMEFK